MIPGRFEGVFQFWKKGEGAGSLVFAGVLAELLSGSKISSFVASKLLVSNSQREGMGLCFLPPLAGHGGNGLGRGSWVMVGGQGGVREV